MAAAVAAAPKGEGFEQSCARCHDPELRRRWGCDEPTAEPVFHLRPCPFCQGQREDCPSCQGTNQMPIHRCPHKLATRRELDVVHGCALVECGVLPDPGGWHDQPATFVAAHPIVMHEIEHWRSVARANAAKKGGR